MAARRVAIAGWPEGCPLVAELKGWLCRHTSPFVPLPACRRVAIHPKHSFQTPECLERTWPTTASLAPLGFMRGDLSSIAARTWIH